MGQSKVKKTALERIFKLLRELGSENVAEARQLDCAHQLHTHLASHLWDGGEWGRYAYREALASPEHSVRAGLVKYLDAMLAFGWGAACLPEWSLTLSALIEVTTPGTDVVGDLWEVDALAARLSQALNVEPADVLVYPELSDVSAYDGFLAIAESLSPAKTEPPTPRKKSFRFGDGAARGVFRTVTFRVRVPSEQCGDFAKAIETPLAVDVDNQAGVPLGYVIQDLAGTSEMAYAEGRLHMLGLPFSLMLETTFQEGRVNLLRELKRLADKGSTSDRLCANVVVAAQEQAPLPAGVALSQSAEEPSPFVAVLLGDSESEAVHEVALYYEGDNSLLAVMAAAQDLTNAGVAKVLIGGVPLKAGA